MNLSNNEQLSNVIVAYNDKYYNYTGGYSPPRFFWVVWDGVVNFEFFDYPFAEELDIR